MLDLTDLQTAVNFISSSIESQDRKKRKKAIESLVTELEKTNKDNQEFCRVFTTVRSLLWGCVSDPAEIVRDSVLDLMQNLVQNTEYCDEYLNELMPVVLHQLQGHEPSEEIRLKLTQLLGMVLTRPGLEAYCFDIIETLKICLEDKYPAVRQESAKCCVTLSANMDGSVLYENSVKLVTPIVSCVGHKHSKTRILAVQALGAVLKDANWKNVNVQLVFGVLGERLFDEHLGVRFAVVELLGMWLVQLRDRYSFFSRMVPLILSCLGDDHPEVAERAWTVWSEAGRLYLDENESDLKNRLDFLDHMPDNYPEGVKRPNLGCRVLVQRNLVQITTPLMKELTDWQTAVCVKASALLATLVLHAESELTQHMSTILQAMYSIADSNPEDILPKIRDNIEIAAEYIGHFIKPSTWHLLIFPLLETEPTSGKFFILAAIFRGSAEGLLAPYAERLSAILASDDVCQQLNPTMQLEVLKTCRAFLNNVDEVPENVQRKLVRSLVYMTSIADSRPEEQTPLADAGFDCLQLLAEKSGNSLKNLLGKFMKPILDSLFTKGPANIPDQRLLIFILRRTDLVWLDEHADDVLKILKLVANDVADVVVKSEIFETLATVFSEPIVSRFPVKIVNELIVPGLVWKAGMAAERLRTVILACLISVTRNLDETDGIHCMELLSGLLGCVRDPPRMSRKLAQDGIGFVMRMMRTKMNTELVNQIFPKVVERLDDVEDDVRSAAVTNLKNLFASLPEEMQETSHSAIFAYFVKTMLPYLDDDNEPFRQSVFDALKILRHRAPNTLQSTIKPKAHLFKHAALCEQLLA